MRSFRDYRNSVKEQHAGAVLVWGRFNPPTRGHEHVFNKAAQIANENRYKLVVMTSHSVDEKTNPLSYDQKIQFMRDLFPRYASAITESEATDIVKALAELNETHRNVIIACGEDRLESYTALIERGNHDYFDFDLIEVKAVGVRNAASPGVRGVSSSRSRQSAVDSNFTLFESTLPSGIDADTTRNLYQSIRDGLGVRNTQLERSEVREQFYSGELCNVGDIVEMNDGMKGPVVVKGANYVIIESDGKRHRYWATDIRK